MRGEAMDSPTILRRAIEPITRHIAGRALDAALEAELNRAFPVGGEHVLAIERACRGGIAGGWLCRQGEGRRRFGRVFEPEAALARFSVDVVDITDLVGNHHVHPTGEIDLVMPVDATARFDGRGAGWLVYPPGSGHHPTVTDGRALILYLLPEGRIEWTAAA
jgi:hypothetical protein